MEANFERDSLRQSVTVLEAILSRAFDQYYLHFNHLLYPLFAVIHVFLSKLSIMVTPKNEVLQILID